MGILRYPLALIKKAANLVGYELMERKHAPIDPIIEKDRRFMKIYWKVRPFTMTPKETMHSLYQEVEYIINKKIPGDFVECGVWKGGSAMIIAYTLLALGVKDRKIYLYDTFEGMSEPTWEDHLVLDKSISAMSMWKGTLRKTHSAWHYSPLHQVRKNMISTGYPKKNIVFVKGMVEDTLKKIYPRKISLLRIDTDWYMSTKAAIDWLYPRLVKGGIIILDDYGHWAGAKKAADENSEVRKLLLTRIDHSCRMGIKI